MFHDNTTMCDNTDNIEYNKTKVMNNINATKCDNINKSLNIKTA